MEDKNIKILLIEDNPDDAALMKRRLSRSANAKFTVTAAKTLREGLAQLERDSPDLIISDLGLPDSSGLDTVTRILSKAPQTPLVVLSGYDDEATAIKAVKAGAQDYLVKGQLKGIYMERSIFYAIERARMQRKLKQHAREILGIQTNLLKILEKNADAIIVVGEDRRILFTNPAVETLLGRGQKELINQPFIYPLDGGKTTEIEIARPDKARTIAEMRVVDITWEGDTAYLASLRDIAERKKAEETLIESEEKFSKAFRSSPEVIVITRLIDSTVLEVNDTFLRLTGYTREEIAGKKMTELGVWAEQGERADMIKILQEEGAVRNKEYFFRMKSGEIRTWLFSAETATINHELCILSVTTDITERRKAEEAVRRAAEEWQTTFDSINDMVSVQDNNFNLVRVNKAYAHAVGMKPEDLYGRKCYEILHLKDCPLENCPHSRTLRTKKTANIEIFEPRLGIYLDVTTSPILNQAGDLTGTVHIAKDITERKKAEEVLRFSDAVFMSIHESVIATDSGFTITHWNNISEQIYGIEASHAIGKRLLDVFEIVETHPGENDKRFKTLETNGYFHEEQLHRTSHGEVWVDVSVQAIEDEQKRYGWVALATAITQRKQAEEALKHSEEKYRTIFENTGTAIAIIETDTTISMVNDEFARIMGLTKQNIEGKAKWTDLVDKADLKQMSEYHRLRREGAEVPKEYEFRFHKLHDETGLVKHASIVVSLIPETKQSLVSITDITERKEAEEKLRQIDKMKSEFLSNVSHELRTPLQSISGFTKLIMNGQVPDAATQQEFLQVIDREVLHLGNLINSLLDMSRLEAGRFQVNRKLTPVRDCFTEPVKSFYSLARDKNITLLENIPGQLPEMEVDGERLRQVVINLLGNAIKFSDPGGSVTVKVEKQDDQLLFQLSDRGIGISEEAKKHLFERFYRAEGEMVRGGTGLGLYISKQIIEAHGGRLWADRKLGEGRTFSFTLPLNSKGGNGNGKENPGH